MMNDTSFKHLDMTGAAGGASPRDGMTLICVGGG
jgi:hypothetical protein